MPIFSATVQAALAGRTVRRARLVFFDFASGPMRLFEGAGPLRTADGQVWAGAGELGQISDIESAIGGTAPTVTFTLSGVDSALIAPAVAQSDEVKGRDVVVYAQHFDEAWAPLDGPYATFRGVMDQMTIKADGDSRTIELTAEGAFTRRGYAPFSYLSDRDQKRLHPGDRGLEFVASMASKTVSWPVF